MSEILENQTIEKAGLSPDGQSKLNALKKELDTLSPADRTKKIKELLKGEIQNTSEQDRKIIVKELRRSEFLNFKESKNLKIAKILEKRNSFDVVNVADVLALKKEGAPLYSYLLTNKKDITKEVNLEDLIENSEFEVNFGSNPSMKSSVGAGDILPVDVYEVEINGKRGIREYGSRPGYYTKNEQTGKKQYIPVYDGDTIKVISKKKPSESELKLSIDAENEHYLDMLVETYAKAKRQGKNPKEVLSYLSEEQFKEVEEQVVENEKYEKARRAMEPDANNYEDFVRFYGDTLNKACQEFNIPPELMLRIYEKESGFKMVKNTTGSSASGIGQITDDTWLEIQNKMVNRRLDRESIEDNIIASVALMGYHRKYRNGDLFEALGDYVTGPGSAEAINKKRLWRQMISGNPKIARTLSSEFANSNTATNESLRAFREASVMEHFGFSKDQLAGMGQNLNLIQVPEYTSELKPTDVPSIPMEKYDGMTYCSRTARKNGYRFGLELPQGNASDVGSQFPKGDKTFLSGPGKVTDKNFADLNLTSKSPFGHRAVAFRAVDGEWYVLDPYRKAAQAMLASEYCKENNIINIAFHTVDKKNIPSIRIQKLIASA